MKKRLFLESVVVTLLLFGVVIGWNVVQGMIIIIGSNVDISGSTESLDYLEPTTSFGHQTLNILQMALVFYSILGSILFDQILLGSK